MKNIQHLKIHVANTVIISLNVFDIFLILFLHFLTMSNT